ncbi:ubiquitin-activating enzyme-like protein [Leptomonas seymouri]|uniref:Ubiquitin-activating enzyme-like protein n=1 Tax=Leptomonas seymouri TaxID=5684 RepID=A0A0N1PEH2_LEPSE|nr:ubiquitin-activating enzyme-like protein [Leptomonas seymouri]|eukprot:KPI90654.1 ubiquitin-activating enzyme-like protein [Leptomonas seymouri]
MEARVGHIVIPQEAVQGHDADTNAGTAHEPSAKRPRFDAGAFNGPSLDKGEEGRRYGVANDVVVVTELSVNSLRGALRGYALETLERDGESSVALEVIQAWPKEASTEWPVVMLPESSSSSSWVTWSFCFVPLALDRKDGDANDAFCPVWAPCIKSLEEGAERRSKSFMAATSQGCTPAMPQLILSKATIKALAAIPLPRKVQIVASGCVSAVLSERVCLPDEFSSIPALHADPHSVYPSSYLPTELLSKPLLLVGAGGIGCELLKVLVLSGFTHIHLIDLDTIDATNLNRQFLFQLPDVGHSKAETACRVVLDWFRQEWQTALKFPTDTRRQKPHVVAYHDNIKARRFDDAFYHQFAVVLNALDNVAARQHVNRMCMRNGTPLIESGTMGYNGQVQPIVKGVYECYDCRPKPPDKKTFAVCTIHARPTTMVHCVHYAKELYEVLFGGAAGAAATSSGAAQTAATTAADVNFRLAVEREDGIDPHAHDSPQQQGGESELAYLQTLVAAWRAELQQQHHQEQGHCNHRTSVQTLDCVKPTPTAAQLGAQLLCHLFVDKIEELLALKSSWPTEPPTPLDRTEVERVVAAHERALASSQTVPLKTLAVDEVLSLPDCMTLFEGAVAECLNRPAGVAFKKEDDAAVRFVSATANLRAHVFHITEQPLEEVRSIAGSIVPAIATTNAIIAAAVVHELVALLQSAPAAGPEGGEVKEGKGLLSSERRSQEAGDVAAPHVVYARKVPQARRRRLPAISGRHHVSPSLYTTLKPHGTSSRGTEKPHAVVDAYLVHSTCPNPPNSLHCLICQEVNPTVLVQLDMECVTLGQLVHSFLEDVLCLEGPSVSHNTTMLYEDEDYEGLADKTLAELMRPSFAAAEQSNTHAMDAEPHRFVLTADALNKEVPWSVVLVDAPQTPSSGTAGTMKVASSVDGEGTQLIGCVFTVSGLEQARISEQRALARLGEQRRLQEEGGREAASTEYHRGEPAANSYALPYTAEVIISDDEVSDVEEVTGGNSAELKSATVQRVHHGREDDAVVVLDD